MEPRAWQGIWIGLRTMDRPLKETVYTPNSELLNFPRLLRHMGRDLLVSRELAWRLLVRNISAQYRQSLLGTLRGKRHRARSQRQAAKRRRSALRRARRCYSKAKTSSKRMSPSGKRPESRGP